MSHDAPGQLASYNSLQDKHLSGYFNNSRMKRHLVKSGLISKKGKIIDEKTYRLNMAKKEHRKHVRDLLATAIIHKALDLERRRQHEIRKRLDDIYKVELVRRVKEDRKKKGDEDILPLLTPRERSIRRRNHVRPSTAPAGMIGSAQPAEIHFDDNTGKLCYTIEGGQETAVRTYLKDDEDVNAGSPYTRAYPGTYPVPAPPPVGAPRRPRPNSSAMARKRTRPLRFHYLARTEPAVAHRVQLQSMAEVTMKFLGPSLMLTNSLFPEDRLCEVMVLQQHCGGSTLCVFRELLPPNTIFTFVSRRHRGAPFGLTFYIDSLQNIRLSSCCEYKHKPGHILGGRNGHFQFVQVEGAAPCYRCQVASGVPHYKPRTSIEQEGEINENSPKAFLTQDEVSQSRESFDVLITKVDQSDNENTDSSEKVDGFTQTPRDEKEEIEAIHLGDAETTLDNNKSSGEEKDEERGEGDVASGKYDDDFEDEDGNEEKNEKESEDEKPQNKELESYYNDDFDSEKEESDKESDKISDKDLENVLDKVSDKKSDKESDEESDKESDKKSDKESDEESDEESDKESDKETDKESDKESDKVSNRENDKESDKESYDEAKKDESEAEEVPDETEKKEDVKPCKEDPKKEENEEDNIEDETEKKEEKQEENDSVHDSDSDMKPSRTVSFDEDVKIIPVNENAGNVEDEIDEQNNKTSEDKPEEIPEVSEDDTDTKEATPTKPKTGDGASGQVTSEGGSEQATPPVENQQQDEEVKDGKEMEKIDESQINDKDKHIKVSETGNADVELKVNAREDSFDNSNTKPDNSLEMVSPEITESDSSRSSSSSDSDSDSDDDKDGADEPDHDPGNDPDLVAGEKLPDQALKVIGVTPGTKHDGSIQPLLEDKKDIELTSLVLDTEQVIELAGIIDSKEDVGSVTLRNTEINDESVEKLVEVLKKSSSVKMLNLNVNQVGPQGAQHIANLIRESKSLRMLLLHGNPLQDEGVHDILNAIVDTKDTALTNLDLGDCKMKDTGAKDVARLLLNNTTITDLTISGNTIGLNGWRIISSALEENKTLKSFSLDFSNLGDEEAVILSEGIKENKGLRSLDLEGNKIGNEGGKCLLEAVKVNPTIVDLTLMPMNEISKEICDEIKGVLEERSKSRVSSASGSVSSLLSKNDPRTPSENEADSDTVERPTFVGDSKDLEKEDEVEKSKNSETSSAVDNNESTGGNGLDEAEKSSHEDPEQGAPEEASVAKETGDYETPLEEIKKESDETENFPGDSHHNQKTVDYSNPDDQKF